MALRFLVFQHIALEHPGIFRRFLKDDGITWDAVELDEGEAIPDLAAYDALWVMGGPMDTWQEDEHPWLKSEKAAIRSAIEDHGLAYFGLCLGHQLLAEALGGKVGPAKTPEIGMLSVNLTQAGKSSPFMAGLDAPCPCLQWHSAEVIQAPAQAVVLAETPACRVQAMSVGTRVFSAQYHVEIEDDTVANWGDVPAYAQALDTALGAEALPRFKREADALLPQLNRDAKRLYDNFMAAAFPKLRKLR